MRRRVGESSAGRPPDIAQRVLPAAIDGEAAGSRAARGMVSRIGTRSTGSRRRLQTSITAAGAARIKGVDPPRRLRERKNERTNDRSNEFPR